MSEPFDKVTVRSIFDLRIITPERVRLQVSVYWLQAPTVGGMLGIWPLHLPLLDSLAPGEVEYEAQDGVHRERIEGGMLHVRQGQVIVLTGSAEGIPPPGAEALETWEQNVHTVAQVTGDLEETGEVDTIRPEQRERTGAAP